MLRPLPGSGECWHISGGVATLNHRLFRWQASGLAKQEPLTAITKMTRLLLALILFSLPIGWPVGAMDNDTFHARQRAWEDQSHITRGDLSFFFDRISFTGHDWEFKVSPNLRGMLWRMRKDKSDITGACNSGQVLNLPAGASLEIKQKGLVLFFAPAGLASFQVRLLIDTKVGDSTDHEQREAILAAQGTGFGLMYAED